MSGIRPMAETPLPERPVSPGECFLIFFTAGMAFGAGLGILAVLENELVSKRGLVPREEFLTHYGLARMLPVGEMTLLAVAYGHRFLGLPGTVIALAGLVLPSFVVTVALTALYTTLRGGPLFDLLPITVIPASLGLILAAALRLSRTLLRSPIEVLLATAGLAGAALLDLHPVVLLVASGMVSILLFRPGEEGKQATPSRSREGSGDTT